MSNLPTGGVLTAAKIRSAVADGHIEIDPWLPEHVGPNSVDMRLSNILKVYDLRDVPDKCLDMRRETPVVETQIPEEGIILEPGILYLGCTIERTHSNHFVPKVEGRSSVGRLGIKVHLTAGFGDIGFNGRWTLEIEVTHPVRVYAGERICQVYFSTPSGPVADLYQGRYQGDLEPCPSRFHLPTKAPKTVTVPFKAASYVPGQGFLVQVDPKVYADRQLKKGMDIYLQGNEGPIHCTIQRGLQKKGLPSYAPTIDFDAHNWKVIYLEVTPEDAGSRRMLMALSVHTAG